ncbi:hypothetical protein [Nitratireductor sp. XY-223]|uniref:hypothetical protein n=1 Tax=Nitratireductor sp. XY-223 TaxID=2561926 RepID=UPI0010AA5AB3|nr:hypothetical protein [Nitratireductor sp. XY-223]
MAVLYLVMMWMPILLGAAYGNAVGARLAGDRSIGNTINLIFSGIVLVAILAVTLVYNAAPRGLDLTQLDDAGDATLAVVLSVVACIIAASIRAKTGGRSYMAMALALWFAFTIIYLFTTADNWSAQALDAATRSMFEGGENVNLTHEQRLQGVTYQMPGSTALFYLFGSIVSFCVGWAIALAGDDP